MKTTMCLHTCLAAVVSALLTCGELAANASPGQLDSRFDLTDGGRWAGLVGGGNISIARLEVLPGDKIIVGGAFDSVNATNSKSIVRLSSDGAIDASFRSPFVSMGWLSVLEPYPDGKLLVCGYLAGEPGIPVTRLYRLNADGTIDATFNPQISDSQQVLAAAVDDQKRILVGLSWYWSEPLIFRLMPDGSLDQTFHPPSAYVYPAITSIVPLADGKILIAGAFDGPPRSLALLDADGTVDQSFDAHLGFNDLRPSLKAVAIQTDGKIVVAGTFNTVAGTPCTNLARLNADGTLDQTFKPRGLIFSKIDDIALQPDQKIIVGGYLTASDAKREVHKIARLLPDGNWDSSFDDQPFQDVCEKNEVVQVALDSTNRLLVSAIYGGDYTVPGALVYRLLTNGTVDTSFDVPQAGGTPQIQSVKAQPDGSICIAGAFYGIRDQRRNGFARLSSTGAVLPGWQIPESYRGEGNISITLPDGSMIVGGTWQESTAQGGCTIFKFLPDGTLDSSWFYDAWSSNSMSVINDMTVTPEGKVIVVGMNQEQWSAIQQLMPNGRPDPGFYIPRISGADGVGVEKVLRLQDGKLLITGEVTMVDDRLTHGFVRLSSDGTFDYGFDHFLGGILNMSLQPDGKVLLAGSFPSTNPQKVDIVRRLNPDGTVDPSLVLPDELSGQANSACVQPNGKIVAGGGFNVGPGTNAVLRRLVRLMPDGSLDQEFIQGAANDIIPDMDIGPDGTIFLGGTFSVYNGNAVPGLACVMGDPVARSVATRVLPAVVSPGDKIQVSIVLTVAPGATAFALEDAPPLTWTVTNISKGGVFDSSSGRLRFTSRQSPLTYTVIVPEKGVGPVSFSGRFSIDGVTNDISGTANTRVVTTHPADRSPANYVISEVEMNAYAAAWRNGVGWPGGPVPIPQSYVSSAAFLWASDTNYTVYTGPLDVPLCWLPVSTVPIPWEQGGTIHPVATPMAMRSAEHGFIEGQALKVRVAVQPGEGTLAFTVEETLPEFWTPVMNSGDFTFDPIAGTLRWGPYFGSIARVLEYQVIPTASTRMRQPLHGVISCDGVDFPITGMSSLKRTCHLRGARVFPDGAMSIETDGLGPVSPILEASDDLIHWTELPYQETDNGVISVYDPYKNGANQRYYRVRID